MQENDKNANFVHSLDTPYITGKPQNMKKH